MKKLDERVSYNLKNLSENEATELFNYLNSLNKDWTNKQTFITKDIYDYYLICKEGKWGLGTIVTSGTTIDATTLFEYEVCNAVVPIETKTFYFCRSKHGDNFYEKLDTINVKNKYHDWETYVRYKQLGSNLIFAKPEEMFMKEFQPINVVIK